MKLSAKGRYAIKALVNIATNESSTPKTLLEISKYQGISLSYLEQLFSLLRKHDIVSGVRGPGGGYRLKDSPDNITIASIIKAINPEGSYNVDHDKTDDAVWDKFSTKLTNYLDTVTLGSLINETKSKSNDIDLDIGQTSAATSADVDIVGQTGSDSNVVAATVDGTSAILTITINGDSNNYLLDIDGNGDINGHTLVHSHTGGLADVDITQSGINDNIINLTTSGDSHNIDIIQRD